MASKAPIFSHTWLPINLPLAHSFPTSKASLHFLNMCTRSCLRPYTAPPSARNRPPPRLYATSSLTSFRSSLTCHLIRQCSLTPFLKQQRLSPTRAHSHSLTALYTILLFFKIHIDPRHIIYLLMFCLFPPLYMRNSAAKTFLLFTNVSLST